MSARDRLIEGNRLYLAEGGEALRERTARDGQHPYAIVVCCSDSRVIPERIFHADIGDLFVVRAAGNVLGQQQLGSIEYAVGHLGCRLVLILGHTGCGAVAAALSGHAEGFVSFITDEIRAAIGMETDADAACRKNVIHGVHAVRETLKGTADLQVIGAVYDIGRGTVDWI